MPLFLIKNSKPVSLIIKDSGIVAIKRGNTTIIPGGSDEIKANDIVYFITRQEDISFLREQAGKVDYKINSAMIMGRKPDCTRNRRKFCLLTSRLKYLKRQRKKFFGCGKMPSCDGHQWRCNGPGLTERRGHSKYRCLHCRDLKFRGLIF